MNTLFSLLFVTLLSFNVSYASERTGGNGGGFGEMKALKVFQSLNRYVNLCLANTSNCPINSSEEIALRALADSLNTELSLTPIDFRHDIETDYVTGSNQGDILWIRPSSLYNSLGLPKSFGEIGSIVLQGLLSKRNSVETSKAIGDKVFAFMQETGAVVANGENLIRTVRVLKHGVVIDELIAIEYADRSVDLTATVIEKLGCESPRLEFSSLHTQGKTTSVALNFVCAATKGNAVILIQSNPMSVRLTEVYKD